MTMCKSVSPAADAWVCEQPEFLQAQRLASAVRAEPFTRAARLPKNVRDWPAFYQNVLIPHSVKKLHLETAEDLVYVALAHCYLAAREIERRRAVVVCVEADLRAAEANPGITAEVVTDVQAVEREARRLFDERWAHKLTSGTT